MNTSRQIANSTLLFASLLLIQSIAYSQVTITNIAVVEDHYSEKIIAADIEYDGSMGSNLVVGALAWTERETYRTTFGLSGVPVGNTRVNIAVERPATDDNTSIDSWGIAFRFGTVSGGTNFEVVERMDLHWRSFSDFFEISDQPEEILNSISTVKINEALDGAQELIQWIGSRSQSIDSIEIHRNFEQSIEGMFPIIVLQISEDVSFDDLRKVFSKMSELDISPPSLRFVKLDDQFYEPGLLSFYQSGSIGFDPGEGLENQFTELLELDSLQEVYAATNFEPTPPEEFSQTLLDNIIALNDEESILNSRKAQHLVDVLLERDPDQARAYVEMARSQFRILPLDERVPAAKNIIDLALQIFPDDAYVNHYAGYLEFASEDYQKAILLFQLAEQQREDEIIWLRNNWAETLVALDRHEDALEMLAPLMSMNDLTPTDERALFYGLNVYSRLLVSERKRNALPVFQKIIKSFPGRSRCLNIDMAEYILWLEKDADRARQTLGRGEQYGCERFSLVESLINVWSWFENEGSRAELYRSFLGHPQVDELIYAIANSFEPSPLLTALKENGVDLDQTGEDDISPLFFAVYESNPYAISALASAGSDVDQSNEYGYSPLLLAVFQEDLQSVEALIKAGANPNLEAEAGFTPLELAEQSGFSDIVRSMRSQAPSEA